MVKRFTWAYAGVFKNEALTNRSAPRLTPGGLDDTSCRQAQAARRRLLVMKRQIVMVPTAQDLASFSCMCH